MLPDVKSRSIPGRVFGEPYAEEMTIQLMGLIITFGEILAETVEYVIADETGTQSV